MKRSMQSLRSLVVPMGVAIGVLGMGMTAHAAKKLKPEEITCEDFLALGTEVQPHVVYWLEGYSASGKLEEAELDVDALDRPVAMLVTECHEAPKATVWQKIKDHL